MLKMNPDFALLAPARPFTCHLPIRLDGVDLGFKNRSVFANLNATIGGHGITAIMGPNGAGKSLLLRLMAGLLRPDHGDVLFNGSARVPAGRIGFVFQRPVLLRRTVLANVLHALAVAGVPRTDRQARATELLALGEMHGLAASPARKLSGGEQQRLSLLRALACKPGLLLLDEPSASLDPQATLLIENIIRRASDCGVKVVIVTHDQGQAARLADEVMFVHQGQVMDTQDIGEFLNRPGTAQARAYLAGELLID